MALRLFITFVIAFGIFQGVQVVPIGQCTPDAISEIINEFSNSLNEYIVNATLDTDQLLLKQSEDSSQVAQYISDTKELLHNLYNKICNSEIKFHFDFWISLIDNFGPRCVHGLSKRDIYLIDQVKNAQTSKEISDLEECGTKKTFGGCWIIERCSQRVVARYTNKIDRIVNEIRRNFAFGKLRQYQCMQKFVNTAMQIESEINEVLLKCDDKPSTSTESDHKETNTDENNDAFTEEGPAEEHISFNPVEEEVNPIPDEDHIPQESLGESNKINEEVEEDAPQQFENSHKSSEESIETDLDKEVSGESNALEEQREALASDLDAQHDVSGDNSVDFH